MAKRKKPEGISIEKALEIDARLKAENEAATEVTNPAYGKFEQVVKGAKQKRKTHDGAGR